MNDLLISVVIHRPICFSVKYDDNVTYKSSQPAVNNLCLNKTNSSATPTRRTAVRDESFIVATEVKDSNEMSEERLREAFEVINATADRILDQIDKVGSFNNDDSDTYYLYEKDQPHEFQTEKYDTNNGNPSSERDSIGKLCSVSNVMQLL